MYEKEEEMITITNVYTLLCFVMANLQSFENKYNRDQKREVSALMTVLPGLWFCLGLFFTIKLAFS